HADKLDFNHIEMDDQGKEVREILSCMPDVTFLDMDFCGVDDEHMAKIRDDFPNVKVVWRIWFGTNYSVRTDVEKILASAPQVGGMLTPETTKSLIYCTDLKYLDIGHNEGLKDLYFVRYMPKLEVLICMWGSITDISPLADCPHLEFLEIFTNNITDISPLKDLHELKHLNMCWNLGLTDLSPIYGLTQLERLWIGTTTGIPRDQIEKFKEMAPDCEVNDWCGDPHTNWRWGTERYALLQEQFGYVNYEYEFYWRDPLYYPHDDKDENGDDGKT
ncbi:MAG: leucine-rich repeat domain-containing protein, partial [Lachnospiraceae bacterium]|nr:leucine-rich repeat domain-containing protein [Lachnospiraceae bacterium]